MFVFKTATSRVASEKCRRGGGRRGRKKEEEEEEEESLFIANAVNGRRHVDTHRHMNVTEGRVVGED